MGVSWYPCKNHSVCGNTHLADCDSFETHRLCTVCGTPYCNYCASTYIQEQVCVYCNGSEIRPENLLE